MAGGIPFFFLFDYKDNEVIAIKLILTKSPSALKRMSTANVQKAYLEIAEQLDDLQAGRLQRCNCCGEFYRASEFYQHKDFQVGFYPVCKKCLLEMATDDDPKNKRRIDNRDKTLRVFNMLNWPFVEEIYQKALNDIIENNTQRGATAYQQLVSTVTSLPQFRKMRFSDSIFTNSDNAFEIEIEPNKKARKEIRKIFGYGYSESDYLFLQDQYDDFRARTQVDSKSQEIYVTQICLQLLEIDKDRKAGRDVSKKLSALDSYMASAKLQPKQNAGNGIGSDFTFSELLEQWEDTKPVPEVDPEFKDVDGIWHLLKVFFGWIALALGIKNVYTAEYEKEARELEVQPLSETSETVNEDNYARIFGKDGD